MFMRQHERQCRVLWGENNLQIVRFLPMPCLFVIIERWPRISVKFAYISLSPFLLVWYPFSILFCPLIRRYFCRVCSTLDVDPSDLNAISVVCVILAAKYEERSSKIPSYSDLLHFIPNEFKSAKSLARWELRVLSVLQWECHCNTAAHFLNLLLSVLENSLGNQFDSLRHLALDLLQNLLLWYPTILTRPSFLASGVVAAARQMLGMPWARVGRR